MSITGGCYKLAFRACNSYIWLNGTPCIMGLSHLGPFLIPPSK